jgi:chemotaxis family two-component system response regulator Rcp1
MSPRITHRKHIILVEDNPSDVFLLRQALAESGVDYSLEVIADGEKALKYLTDLHGRTEVAPDLVILDLNLPRHTGIEVLENCRHNRALPGVPIVVFTSSESPQERQRVEELGVADYVRKPLLLEDFMAVGGRIKKLLAGLAVP